ncbi:PA0069 family radical SAM protein [Phaeobacter inhibens]|uniref:PA0069 family radical SAM protein n=1 Tax=Phaeobacter inhibens TaxID=221822 RepID=UPI00076BB02E|nr:PA0069 family radical SAM protein [Phaeobacter inhibens]KXF90143.1 DNA repair photolyase [Phaeobacter inhibens]WHP69970.1 PA0069 family radical SAM protein [Phaeobacter inhibens]
MTEILPSPPQRRKARASLRNAAGRFDMTRDAIDDGWGDLRDSVPDHDGVDLPQIETNIRHEVARSLISYNKSPDLPFDRSINTYRGCEHGCIYCFARPSHAYLGLSPGLDFETRLIARPNAAEVLRRELSQPRYKVAPIAIGTNTDPYQPCERDLGLTRACLEVLDQFSHPVAIVTKGTLIERDLDILSAMAARGLVRVGISVTTLDPDLSRRMEPRAPSPARRLATIRRLSDADVPVRIMTSPIVPGLTDHELEALLAAGVEAGADAASWIMLRLPREVSELWQEWLAEHVPLRAEKVMARLREMHGGRDYDPRWGHRMRGEGPYAEVIANRFKTACKRLGLLQKSPESRCDLFAKPAQAGDQLALF